MTISESPKAQAIRELDETTCDCGQPKPAKRSFCQDCYFDLPLEMRSSLYARFGSGYEENYQAAKDWLREERKASGRTTVKDKQPSITCPTCGMTSYNPNDISERYCGACHKFLRD